MKLSFQAQEINKFRQNLDAIAPWCAQIAGQTNVRLVCVDEAQVRTVYQGFDRAALHPLYCFWETDGDVWYVPVT
eukprot:5617283-Amphidinium_carterae.1